MTMLRLMLVGSVACFSVAAARAEGFKDARDEEVTFGVKKAPSNFVKLESKAPKETVKGTSKELTGKLTLNPAKLDKAEGEFKVPFKSLDTGHKTRNEHMLSSDWIDAASHPDAVLTITGLEEVKVDKKKGASATVNLKGKMKIHGVEKDVSLPMTIAYVMDKKKDGKKDTLAIRGKFEIKLADYEIKGKAGVVGNKVAETLKLMINVSLAVGEKTEDAEKPEPPRPRTRVGVR